MFVIFGGMTRDVFSIPNTASLPLADLSVQVVMGDWERGRESALPQRIGTSGILVDQLR